MTKLMGLATLSLLSLTAASSLAQTFALSNGDSRSAFRDTSNLYFFDGANYQTDLSTVAGGSATYLNQITLDKSANWDSALDLAVPTTDFNYHNTVSGANGSYTLGTAIPADSHWNFEAASRRGDVDSLVPDGIYTANLNFLGGATSSAMTSLQSFTLTLQVTQKLDVDVSTSFSPGTIAQGETTQLSMTVKNNMTGLNFVSYSQYTSTGFTKGSDSLAFGEFNGDWHNKTVLPNESRTDLHTTWSAAADQSPGVYTGIDGLFGGLYLGDFYAIHTTTPTSITVVRGVVPAPSASLVLLIGAVPGIGFLLRRRRN